MNTLLTLILLWVCSVAALFLIKIYKILLSEQPSPTPVPSTKQPDDDIIGKAQTVFSESLQSKPILPTPKQLSKEMSDDELRDVTKEYIISGLEAGDPLSTRCTDCMDEGDDKEENPDAVDFDQLQSHLKAMTGSDEDFEQTIKNPKKLAQLLGTTAKMENTLYFNKLKENKQVNERAQRLTDIAMEVYRRNIQQSLFDNTLQC